MSVAGASFIFRGGVNNIYSYASWTGEVLAMAIRYIALVWCGSRPKHRTCVKLSSVSHTCDAFSADVRYNDRMARESVARY